MIIDLDYCIGLLIKKNTGIKYSNQVGGYACNHPVQEGVFIPLIIDKKYQDILNDLFAGKDSEYGGWCCDGIGKDTANIIDNLFQEIPFCCLKFFKVDRNQLKNSQEAWIHVMGEVIEDCYGLPKGKYEAIFTFENSD